MDLGVNRIQFDLVSRFDQTRCIVPQLLRVFVQTETKLPQNFCQISIQPMLFAEKNLNNLLGLNKDNNVMVKPDCETEVEITFDLPVNLTSKFFIPC